MAQDELTGPKELKNARLNDEGEAEGRLKHLNEKGTNILYQCELLHVPICTLYWYVFQLLYVGGCIITAT